jgi:hypothetical protein
LKSHHLTALRDMTGDSRDDALLLDEMAVNARAYITPFSWCPPIAEEYLGDGVGGIVAIFLFVFSRKIKSSDTQLWVVVGDVPSAYLVVESGDSPIDALNTYCGLMDDWIANVRANGDGSEVFPVTAARTKSNADSLETRLKFIREELIERSE